jgi:hypothetical protein
LVSHEQWPELVHPFASAIDTELPKAPSSMHLVLRDKANWVEPQIGPNDDCFDGYPEFSIENWHKKQGLWGEGLGGGGHDSHGTDSRIGEVGLIPRERRNTHTIERSPVGVVDNPTLAQAMP